MPTHMLLDALRNHFIKPDEFRPGAVFLTEVTAPDRTHRADAIHVGLWASRGYTVDVCELKTSHADFRRELDKPDKAEAWWPHSNTFWIVAPNTRVAPPEMLPPGWGLMVPGGRGRKFKTVVAAQFRELRPAPALMAALMVSMETDRNNALEAQRRRLDDQRYRELDAARRESAMQTAPAEVRDKLKHLEELEQLLGFELEGWDGNDTVGARTLAASIREVVIERQVSGRLDWVLQSLARDAGALAKAADQARKDLASRSGDVALLPEGVSAA